MNQYLIMFLVSIMLFCACNNEGQKTSETNSPALTSTQNTAITNQKEGTLASQTTTSIDGTGLDFLTIVESILCTDYKDNLEECYHYHATGLKNDFLQQLPLTISPPYNSPIDWVKYKVSTDFETLWSSKCGFINEENGVELRYHCPNLRSSFGIWLDSLSQTNNLVKHFNESYSKTESFMPQLQQFMILQSTESLDFSNKDHKTFYWIYHFALAELRQADQKFAKLNK